MVLTSEQYKILNTLVDKYENSATFRGDNKVNQRFTMTPESLFPKYTDEWEYDFFVKLNHDIADLTAVGFIEISKRNMIITLITLKTEMLDDIYMALKRRPKRNVMSEIDNILSSKKELLKKYDGSGLTDILSAYLEKQQERLSSGKLPEYYENSIEDYTDFWRALTSLLDIRDDVYIRDLSVKLFNDSKKLELLRGRMASCLFKYGDFPEKDTILEELGVIKTPSYVMVRGPIVIEFKDQSLDVGKLAGGIALSSDTLKDISSIKIYGNRVITVENLTSFHEKELGSDEVAIYLGGYHNRIKRDFLKLIYVHYPGISYYHFGDIDAGGFYIYEHLRRLTGVPFMTMNMNIDILKKYSEYSKKLTGNDIERIERLIAKYENGEIYNPDAENITETLKYMLEQKIKLEQEAVRIH